MRKFRILSRNIRDAFYSVFRNFSLSLASISCITITLLVVSISIILSANVNNFSLLVEKDITIVAFMNNDINEASRNKIGDDLKRLTNVQSIEYQDKMDITKEMMESSDTFENIMGNWNVDENPIQSTYLVKVKDINHIADTAKEISKISGIESVKYGEGMIEQLVSVFDVIQKITIGIVVALVIVTAFLISNTIKITISSRKREIDIMRLVGASNLNIKIPFIFEGLFLGIIGSLIPIIVTIYGYVVLYENFDGQVFSPFLKLMKPEPFVYLISLTLLAIGILVGMFGSWKAVRKYLKI